MPSPSWDFVPAPDEHNPPGSNFRRESTRALYGYTPRLVSAAEVFGVVQSAPTPTGASKKPLAPVLQLVPRAEAPPLERVAQVEPRPFSVGDLDSMPLSSRRLALVCATRIIERAQKIEGDGATSENLAFYVRELKSATKAFEGSIKPKSGLRSLLERLFDD